MHLVRFFPSAAVFVGLVCAQPAAAQAPAPKYDYTTLNVFESSSKSLSKLFITPAFQGKTEIQLEDFNAFSVEKNKEKIQTNAQTVNQQLGEMSAAGWELIQVYPLPTQQIIMTRYLLRKPQP